MLLETPPDWTWFPSCLHVRPLAWMPGSPLVGSYKDLPPRNSDPYLRLFQETQTHHPTDPCQSFCSEASLSWPLPISKLRVLRPELAFSFLKGTLEATKVLENGSEATCGSPNAWLLRRQLKNQIYLFRIGSPRIEARTLKSGSSFWSFWYEDFGPFSK